MNKSNELIQGNCSQSEKQDIAPLLYPARWKLEQLTNSQLFAFENGIWTGQKPPFVNCSIIRNTDFTVNGLIDFTNTAVIPIELRQLEKKQLRWGDIIIERSGGGPQQPVGRVVFFDRREGNFCFSNFTSRLRVNDDSTIQPRYLHFYLLYFYLSGQTEMLQKRTTGIGSVNYC